MARYALVSPAGVVDRLSSNTDPNVQTRAGWRWLPCPNVARPSFDSAAEIIEGPSYVVNANSVTETWTKRNLTAQEISEAKDAAISALESATFSPVWRALFNVNNRVRVLEGQPTLTVAQFRATIKALL